MLTGNSRSSRFHTHIRHHMSSRAVARDNEEIRSFNEAMRGVGYLLGPAFAVVFLICLIILPIRILKWAVTGNWAWRIFDGDTKGDVK